MRLHVGEVGAEQFFRAVDRDLLGNVDEFAAAVVAPSRVAFGVLVGELRALRLEYGPAHVVFRRDQFDMVFLAPILQLDRAPEFGIGAARVFWMENMGRGLSMGRGSGILACAPLYPARVAGAYSVNYTGLQVDFRQMRDVAEAFHVPVPV